MTPGACAAPRAPWRCSSNHIAWSFGAGSPSAGASAPGVDPIGAMSYVDAETGALLLRDGIVDYAADNAAWKVFAASPPQDYSSTDTRELWCWTMTPSVPNCQQAVANDASPAPWDVDAALGTPWFLTRGNNARATEKWNSNVGNQQGTNYAASATRDYVYPWTNQWYEERCDPAAFTSPMLVRQRMPMRTTGRTEVKLSNKAVFRSSRASTR